jgi:Uma2 family endonuclease
VPAITQNLMSVEEFLALPDDGVERELINGVVKVRGEAGMTYRNRFHSITVAKISRILGNWIAEVRSHYEVMSGDAGFVLRRDPPATVGADVAVVHRELLDQQSDLTTLVDGAPVLAVEVLSPSDKIEDIHEKRRLYLACGVSLVWIVDPADRTVRVYRNGQPPEGFNENDRFEDCPELPGLSFQIRDLFE